MLELGVLAPGPYIITGQEGRHQPRRRAAECGSLQLWRLGLHSQLYRGRGRGRGDSLASEFRCYLVMLLSGDTVDLTTVIGLDV